MARSMRASGTRPGDIVHIAYGYGLFTGGLGAHYGAERLGCTVVPVSGGMTARQVTLIEDFAATTIMVTPSYMLSILDEYRAQGLDPRQSPLQVGIFGAEPWTNAMRAEIEDAFDMHAVDIYGLSEVMGPGVANECVETKDGLHVWEDHFYPEIIDPATGEPLPDGELGELVFTSLTKEAFPIIRYRTRDLTRLLPGTARSMRRMEKITGRSDDMMILRGVNVFPTQIEEQILKVRALSAAFPDRAVAEGRLDCMTVHVEAAAAGASEAERQACCRGAEERIKEVIGVTVTVDVGATGKRGAQPGQGAAHRRQPAEGLEHDPKKSGHPVFGKDHVQTTSWSVMAIRGTALRALERSLHVPHLPAKLRRREMAAAVRHHHRAEERRHRHGRWQSWGPRGPISRPWQRMPARSAAPS